MAPRRKIRRKLFVRRPLGMKRKRGKGIGDFLAGVWAPVKAAYSLVRGDIGGVEKAFTDLGPRLSKGFNGKGRRR